MLLAESSLPSSNKFLPGTNPRFAIVWSPDWRLVFSVADGPESQKSYSLWQVAVDRRTVEAAGKPQRLTQWSDSWPWNLSITTDGKRLSVENNRSWDDVYLAELGADGSSINPPRRFTLDDRGSHPNCWTHDGQAVLFDSNRMEDLRSCDRACTKTSRR